MAILACCGQDGLKEWHDGWQQISCPLPCPELLALSGRQQAVLDNTEHLLWLGDQLFPVDSGIERLLLWHGHPLILSGDTDCLTLLNPADGTPLFLSPAGVYPQDMCLLPGNAVAVCGGGSGTVLLLQLPELNLLGSIPVPGSPQRIVHHGRWLYILCTLEDDGLQCLLCRADPHNQRCEPLDTMPGLPGALYAARQSLWAAASEVLYRFRFDSCKPALQLGGFGLIRHITALGGRLLLSDPVLGTLTLLEPGCTLRALLSGDIGQAACYHATEKDAPLAGSVLWKSGISPR